VPGDYEGSFENKWTGTLAGRLGVAFDRTLVYAKLGAAVAKNDYTLWLSNTGLTQSSTEIGWLMGAGVEWALGGNWSTKLEATYMDFGQKSHALLGGQLNLNTESHIATANIGIHYKFD
jgi:outer membrane immunogenic protein